MQGVCNPVVDLTADDDDENEPSTLPASSSEALRRVNPATDRKRQRPIEVIDVDADDDTPAAALLHCSETSSKSCSRPASLPVVLSSSGRPPLPPTEPGIQRDIYDALEERKRSLLGHKEERSTRASCDIEHELVAAVNRGNIEDAALLPFEFLARPRGMNSPFVKGFPPSMVKRRQRLKESGVHIMRLPPADVITDAGSIFDAFLVNHHNLSGAMIEDVLNEIKCDEKVSMAAHPTIFAYRIVLDGESNLSGRQRIRVWARQRPPCCHPLVRRSVTGPATLCAHYERL